MTKNNRSVNVSVELHTKVMRAAAKQKLSMIKFVEEELNLACDLILADPAVKFKSKRLKSKYNVYTGPTRKAE